MHKKMSRYYNINGMSDDGHVILGNLVIAPNEKMADEINCIVGRVVPQNGYFTPNEIESPDDEQFTRN